VRDKNFRKRISSFNYDSIYSLLGTFMAGEETLRQFVGDSPVNTDENPVVCLK
jgi:spermidine synthase